MQLLLAAPEKYEIEGQYSSKFCNIVLPLSINITLEFGMRNYNESRDSVWIDYYNYYCMWRMMSVDCIFWFRVSETLYQTLVISILNIF